MPYKVCPVCRQTSYCASGNQIWLCPVCGADISSSAEIQDGRCILHPVAKPAVASQIYPERKAE